MKNILKNLKSIKPDFSRIASPDADGAENRPEKLMFILMIVLATLSMLIYIGGSFVNALRMSQQPSAVEQSVPATQSNGTRP
ncbi:hypothetical protein [Acetobacter sp.]|jgi:hypothetical protein|uniref:hypothetical protein n=1 Tax=Acetobacter sp. TaxID=440 RepID=UPI0025BFD102|nr:hypothetical protein [Acetobacter sp.]MCH4091297.1 hypothetical protein [Acetobacter sp.]MCI1299275.1 hypothetical protein [Acetobacter sp.]MCI1316721.1 hypothetical protein [Acetobacter sp.]